MRPVRRRLFQALPLTLAALLTSACTLLRLQSESKLLDQVVELTGVVEGAAWHGKPLVVVLLSMDPQHPERWKAVLGRTILHRPGRFRFFAGAGTYQICAFEDLDENGSFQPEEPIGWHGAPDPVTVSAGRGIDGLRVALRAPEQARRAFPQAYRPPPAPVEDLTRAVKLGALATLDDPLFSPANGALGMWEPLRFLTLEATGIYFIEPFDPERIPVLFIHGAGGSPGDWGRIIGALDRRHFQPWVLFYPSGLRLEIIRQWASNLLNRLQVQYKFERLYLVAHSMGGLVAGGVINAQLEAGKGDHLRLLVTLSTPWGGHELAQSGVAHSPAVIPSWYDMIPQSPYLEALFARSLPPHVEYHLFFSHRGGFNVMTGDNTDGAVALRSQLATPAQDRAGQVRGFDEDHVSILGAPLVIERLNAILEARRRRDREAP